MIGLVSVGQRMFTSSTDEAEIAERSLGAYREVYQTGVRRVNKLVMPVWCVVVEPSKQIRWKAVLGTST